MKKLKETCDNYILEKQVLSILFILFESKMEREDSSGCVSLCVLLCKLM